MCFGKTTALMHQQFSHWLQFMGKHFCRFSFQVNSFNSFAIYMKPQWLFSCNQNKKSPRTLRSTWRCQMVGKSLWPHFLKGCKLWLTTIGDFETFHAQCAKTNNKTKRWTSTERKQKCMEMKSKICSHSPTSSSTRIKKT